MYCSMDDWDTQVPSLYSVYQDQLRKDIDNDKMSLLYLSNPDGDYYGKADFKSVMCDKGTYMTYINNVKDEGDGSGDATGIN